MAEMKARLESAQHILHHILTHDYSAHQSGMQISENKIRLDMKSEKDLTTLSKEELEDKVNEVIRKSLPVTKTVYPRSKVPKGIDISKIPETVKDVRVVAIGDFDVQPCGNAHVDNTSEIGFYRINEIKKKGKDTYRIEGTVTDANEAIQKPAKEESTGAFELQLAKGVRDFPPEEKIIRDKVLNTIKTVFELYGYNPIEVPILERYETLAAKYAAGEESDALKEIFVTHDNGGRKLGLRFDLTVPFCRYVGMNPDLKMPFKKYIQGQVFRDGPMKKGRYREFTQFDPDVVGCKSVLADAEILAITEEVFKRFGFEIDIEVNNRKLLNGIIEDLSIPEDKSFSVIASIDKFKKIGVEGVRAELIEKGIPENAIAKLMTYLEPGKDNDETIRNLKKHVKSAIGQEGLKEMEELIGYCKAYELKNIKFLPSLARGLAYYTGPVYEVFLKNSTITSSAAGGGRYDKIIGNYLKSRIEYPATGISFGIEVIIEALKERGELGGKTVVKAYVIPIKTTLESIKIAQKLREAGINTDMDLVQRGISKNLEYANTYGIPYVIFAGEDELRSSKLKLRDMKSGKEESLAIGDIIKKLKS